MFWLAFDGDVGGETAVTAGSPGRTEPLPSEHWIAAFPFPGTETKVRSSALKTLQTTRSPTGCWVDPRLLNWSGCRVTHTRTHVHTYTTYTPMHTYTEIHTQTYLLTPPRRHTGHMCTHVRVYTQSSHIHTITRRLSTHVKRAHVHTGADVWEAPGPPRRGLPGLCSTFQGQRLLLLRVARSELQGATLGIPSGVSLVEKCIIDSASKTTADTLILKMPRSDFAKFNHT